MGLLLLLVWNASAQDVTLREPLRTSSGATEIHGGTFTGAGWRVDDSNARMMWDLGTQIDRGSVSFVLDDADLSQLTGVNHHIVELFDDGGHWSATRAINVRVYGSADGATGDVKLKVWDAVSGAEDRGGVLEWDGRPHTWTVTWDATTARLFRDGAELVSLDVTGIDLRVGKLWLPLNDWVADYSGIVGSTYSDLELDGWEPDDGVPDDTGVPDDGDPSTFVPVEDVGAVASVEGVYPDTDDLPAEANAELSYLMFDLRQATGVVTSATLTLHARTASNAGGDGASVYAVDDRSWSEDTLTWASRPPVGTRLGSFGAVSPGDTVQVDVTAGTRAGGKVAFAIVSDGTDGAHFSSKEDGDGSAAATLRVTLAPASDTGAGDGTGGGDDTGAAGTGGDTGAPGGDDRPRGARGAEEAGCGCGSAAGGAGLLGWLVGVGALVGRRRGG